MPIVEAERVRNLKTYLFAKYKGGAKADSGLSTVDLSIGDPDEGVSAALQKEAFDFALKQSQINRYPAGRGLKELRQAIASWMEFRFGVKLDPETEIAVLSGSKEGLAHLSLSILNPGDTALIGDCAYPVYERSSGLAQANVVTMPMRRENGFLAEFANAGKAKIAFFNYPNNPTGASASLEYFKDIAKWAKAQGTLVVSDAAYCDVYFGKNAPPSFLQVEGAKDFAVEFHSFSKSFGLPGLRLGWVCGNAQVISALLRLKDTYDSGVTNIVQWAGYYLLTCKQRDSELARLRSLYGERRALFEKGLKELNVPFLPSDTTFYIFSGVLTPQFRAKLEENKINTVEGAGFGKGGEGCVRFALCAGLPQLKDALSRLKS